MRFIVLGGYGNFGARICRALARDGFEVLAAGRNPEQGHRDAGFDAAIGKAGLDISDVDFERRLAELQPGCVIHCVGPFQGQGYQVAKAALRAGSHYMDLADGRAFVAGFSGELDAAARAAGRLAVTGASTLPALSSAVVDRFKPRFTMLEEIQLSIAPAQRSPRGAATLRAVFSYLGRPFKWLEEGEWREAHGWQELRRWEFLELGRRWAAACDVPDLELFPARYPGVRTVQFRASLEFGFEHFVLAAVAGLRRMGMPVPLDRWAPALDKLATRLDSFGGPHGGMLVSLTGTGLERRKMRLEWHLMADSVHGPEIPCIAAILLARKLARGEIHTVGATPCMGLLTLEEFLPEFERWGIRTQVREVAA